MRVSRRTRPTVPAALLAVLLIAGCAAASPVGPGPPPDREIAAAFEASAVAWNRGDLGGHVAMYADSAAFMTGRGPEVGRERTAEILRDAFFREGRPVQQLRFESLAVSPLGPGHALVTGRFVLTGGGEADRTGWFTTVWERGPAGWRIVHDHSG
jgi:ketosteroid isomerase-like protein